MTVSWDLPQFNNTNFVKNSYKTEAIHNTQHNWSEVHNVAFIDGMYVLHALALKIAFYVVFLMKSFTAFVCPKRYKHWVSKLGHKNSAKISVYFLKVDKIYRITKYNKL